MPSTDRKLELKAKTSVVQTASQASVYAKGLKHKFEIGRRNLKFVTYNTVVVVAVWTLCQAQGTAEPQCDHIGYSPFTIRKEICGSDGQTYSNEKHLEFENCVYRRGKEREKTYRSDILVRTIMYLIREKVVSFQ
jgi:hypothetical protein